MMRSDDQESGTVQVLTSSMSATMSVLVAYAINGFMDVEDLLTDP